jgi:hypothetical protein
MRAFTFALQDLIRALRVYFAATFDKPVNERVKRFFPIGFATFARSDLHNLFDE